MKKSVKFLEKASAAYNKKYQKGGEEEMGQAYVRGTGKDMGTYSKRATNVMGRAQKAYGKAESLRKEPGTYGEDIASRLYGKAERLGKRAKRIQGRFETKMAKKYGSK